MKVFKRYNNLTGWLVFAVSALVYLLTIEPTTSLWDCGEFISSAYKLEVGHPPGAPFFMILARFFSLFASDTSTVAMMINSMSALASAFTILFLFWTITHFARKIIARDGEFNAGKITIILGAGAIGALAYAFSDTFWFSAVEAEVYALSSFFTAVVFWAVLKWEDQKDRTYANRWIVFIAYMMGLSIGVHLLNLLAIPAIVFVYYFKKQEVSSKAMGGFGMLVLSIVLLILMIVSTPILLKLLMFAGLAYLVWIFIKEKVHQEKGFKGILLMIALSGLILGSIMYLIIPGVVKLGAFFELFFVNGLSLPYHSGVIVYIILLISLLIWGIVYTTKKENVLANTIILSLTVIMIGYFSFAAIVIRSYANPPMDENNPENVFSLLNYLNREQYGNRPLITGHYYSAPIIDSKDRTTYIQKNGKYIKSYLGTTYEYDSRFTTLFPRMYSNSPDHIEDYKDFGKIEGTPIQITNPQSGENETRIKPSFSENIRFFLTYQVGYMYARYFMWNFVGRQNDTQGNGGIVNGNWISGIKFIDELFYGPQDNLPSHLKNAPSRNTYFFLPLIIGIIGLIVSFKENQKDFWVIFWLFFMTGLAIVIYLNQYPQQPRERDYAYAASFYAFAIWIGLGILKFYQLASEKLKLNNLLTAIVLTLVLGIAVPGILIAQNWDDHDRSGRYFARDLAFNYLETCDDNAILFTNGDNDTFPLWYAQEVEGKRTDVRVCNLSLLGTDWYIDQMQKKVYESEPVPFSMTHDQYVQGKRDVVYVVDRLKGYHSLKDVMDFMASDDPKTKIKTRDGSEYDYIPGKKFFIPVDKEKVLANGIVPPEMADQIVDTIFFTLNKNVVTKNEMMVLDLLANFNWDRPIYFVSVGGDGDVGIRNYLQAEGFGYRFAPIWSKGGDYLNAGRIDTDILYKNLMEEYEWGRINQKDVFVDYYIVRTLSVLRVRNLFSRLANELVLESKKDSAIQVVNKARELFPKEKVPFEIFTADLVESYYKAGANEEAKAYSKEILEEMFKSLDYYFDLTQAKGSVVSYDMQLALHITQKIISFAKQFGEEEFFKENEERFSTYYMKYAGLQ